ncbi:hypothetical protein [Geodermatophilus sp. SYSU D01119]
MELPDLLSLSFTEVARTRPRSLLAPFPDVDRPGPVAGWPAGLGAGPRAPFCAVVLDLEEGDDGDADGDGDGDGEDADGEAACGLLLPGGPVLARLDEAAGRVELAATGVVLVSAPAAAAPSGLACVVQENRVTVLVRRGDWVPVLTADVSARVDLRLPAVLASAEYAAGARGPRVRRVRAGCSGPAGVRDPQVVRTADGRALVRDGRLYLTMTGAGLGGFRQASWGVWTLALDDPTRAEQVAALYTARDGLLLGDHAGQLVVDEDAGTTTVLVSSWGDHDERRGVHLRTATTGADLLSGVHVLDTAPVDLPTAGSAWDPSLARIGGRWLLAFTECDSFGPPRYRFHPALAATDDADPVRGLVRVAADPGLQQTEGTLLVPAGEGWVVLASDRDAGRYLVHDTRLRRLGELAAPFGTNIPHAMVVPGGPDGATPWLVTFDGTPWHGHLLGYGTHGDLVVMAGEPCT